MTRVLVTGGGTGIGRATALAFAAGGAEVTISGRRAEPLAEAAAGTSIRTQTADVSDEAQVAALFSAPFDVVVANAGFGISAPVRDMRLKQWQDTMDVDLTGVFLTFREALRAGMGSGGRLIAIASIMSLKGAANISAYAAAKHGVLGLVRSLAHEVARDGITCNAVCPGYVDTPLTDRTAAHVATKLGIDEAAARAKIVRANPVGRLIAPEEVAAAVLYLASPAAGQVNGHALTLSGGEV